MVKKSESKQNNTEKNSTNSNDVPFYKKLIISLSLSIIMFFLFSLIYSSIGALDTNKLLLNMGDKIYDYSSIESRDSFLNALTDHCTQIAPYLESLGITDKMSISDVKIHISKSGLDNSQIEQISAFSQICKDREKDKKIFFNSFVGFLLSQSTNNQDSSISSMIEKLENTEGSEINSSTKSLLKIISFLYPILSSPGKMLLIIIILSFVVIVLSFGNFYFLIKKLSKSFIGLGVSFILPFIILKILISKYSIDTSFIFDGLVELLKGTSIDLPQIFMSGLRDMGLLLFELIYPVKIVFFGIIFLIIGIILFILSKVVTNSN